MNNRTKLQPIYRISCLFLFSLSVSACAWDWVQTPQGKNELRQKYPTGTGVYYTNGAASQNTHYHQYRPEPHSVKP